MRRLKALALAGWRPAMAGVAAAAGQAPWDFWPLALLGYGYLTYLVAEADSWRPRLFRAWAGGVGHFAAAMFWIVEPFLVDPARDGWMAPFGVTIMATGIALFWMFAGWIAGLGSNRASRALAFAAGLAFADLLRSYILTGFPWALTGHIWIDTPVAQQAAYVGPIGLSILTMLVAALPVAAFGPARRLFVGLGCTATLLAGAWAFGATRLATADTTRDPTIRVRLVQPNATQSLKWQPGMWDVFLSRQLDATAAPADKPLDLIVWPETAVPHLVENAGFIFEDALDASGGVPVAMGIQRAEGARYYNALIAVSPDRQPFASYDKVHLVPFGEYIPFGDQMARFGISAFASQQGNGYSAGSVRQLMDLGRAGKVLPLICYEAVFPQDLRATPGRADWILQVTNDGWFGALAGPYQHLAQARLRAIEQGLPLLRTANTGITAVIDARGRVLQSLPLDTDGWVDAPRPVTCPQQCCLPVSFLPDSPQGGADH
jgi:apolipoprotein N-acyltransferase